jgi:hypothetical protein
MGAFEIAKGLVSVAADGVEIGLGEAPLLGSALNVGRAVGDGLAAGGEYAFGSSHMGDEQAAKAIRDLKEAVPIVGPINEASNAIQGKDEENLREQTEAIRKARGGGDEYSTAPVQTETPWYMKPGEWINHKLDD